MISPSNFPSEWLHEFGSAVVNYVHQKKGKGVLIVADGWDQLEESLRLEGSFLYKFLFRNRSLGLGFDQLCSKNCLLFSQGIYSFMLRVLPIILPCL